MSHPTIDFLFPPRAPAMGWWLLAVGAASVAAAAWLHHRWDAERAAQQAAMLEQETVQRRAMETARRPRISSVDELRLQRLAPQLQQPWLPALRGIEGATESPVFLLGMTIDPSSGRVQLDGEAPSFDHVLAYVQRLSEDGALVRVHLATHDAVTDPSGRATVRFVVLAQWSRP